MTTECLPASCLSPVEHRLHDAVLGLAVAVIFIIPATLALFALQAGA